MSREQWQSTGFPGYQVSDQGRVRSFWGHEHRGQYGKDNQWRIGDYPRRFLKITAPKGGQPCRLILHVAGKRKQTSVARLVLEAFVGPRPAGKEACHRDDDPWNNCLGNLYWGTHAENMRDAARNGRCKETNQGSKSGKAKLDEDQVHEIKRQLLAGKHQTTIAKEYDVHRNTIWWIAKGRTWQHVT
jgi:hypothetical protein